MKNIYFMRRADGVGPIKIGCSATPLERLKVFQTWSPEKLEIVASVEGNFTDEKCLHNRFAEYRLHSEWFEAAPPVLSCLARVCATGKLPRPLANDRTIQIMAFYEAGETYQEIGERFNVTRQRIEQIVRKAGGEKRGNVGVKRGPIWDDIGKIKALAKGGLTFRQIAEEVGHSYANVCRVCNAEGIEVRKARKGARVKPENVEKAFSIAADYKAGMTTQHIAEKHGIHQPSVYRFLRIAGVQPTRRAA